MIYKIKSNFKTTVKEIISKTISRNFYGFLKEIGASIKVNGNVCKGYYEVDIDDVIEIEYEETEVLNGVDSILPIDIVYEDSNFIVVDKPPFLQSIPSRFNSNDSVYNRLKYYFKGTNNQILIVNRLDKDTKGLMLIAKNRLFRALLKDFDKEYYATTNIPLKEDFGVFKDNVARSNDGIKREISKDGKKAITNYELVKKENGNYQYKIKLETGRTHQIRVHFSSHGYPLIGDNLYGGIKNDELLLVCKKISFTDPTNGNKYLFNSKYEK